MSTKLLFLAGSVRKESLNKKMALAACNAAKDLGAKVTFIDLADYAMPLYDGDYEDQNGVPDSAKKLKAIFMKNDGFFIASPEYNSGYSPLLKNTIDWMTRPMGDDVPGLAGFSGKIGAIGAASPGGLGGIRGLAQLRMLLGNINVHIIPAQVAFSNAHESFDDEGNIVNQQQEKMLKDMMTQFVETAQKMKE